MKGRPPIPAEQLTGIGAQVRRRRLAKGLTIREAAKRAGIPESTWAFYEKGGLESCGRVGVVAGVLGCSVNRLVPVLRKNKR